LVTLGRIVDAASFVLEAASSRFVLGIRVQAFIIGGQSLRVVNRSGGIANKVKVVHPVVQGCAKFFLMDVKVELNLDCRSFSIPASTKESF
jgi:hypothetical protein